MNLLLAATLFLQGLPATDSVRWEVLIENHQGAHYVDPDTIRRDGDRVTFGFRTVLAEEMTPQITTLVALGEIDCVRQTRTVLRFEAYRADGSQVLAEDVPAADRRAEPINTGDALDRALAARVCGGRAR